MHTCPAPKLPWSFSTTATLSLLERLLKSLYPMSLLCMWDHSFTLTFSGIATTSSNPILDVADVYRTHCFVRSLSHLFWLPVLIAYAAIMLSQWISTPVVSGIFHLGTLSRSSRFWEFSWVPEPNIGAQQISLYCCWNFSRTFCVETFLLFMIHNCFLSVSIKLLCILLFPNFLRV